MAAGAGAAALDQDYQHLDVHGRRVMRQGVWVVSLDHLVFELGLPFPHYIEIGGRWDRKRSSKVLPEYCAMDVSKGF